MLINENPRITDVLMFEAGEEVNYVESAVTLASGTVASAVGTVLGQVTASGKYVVFAPAASDGSQNAAAVLITPVIATLTADTTAAVVNSGPAVLKTSGLIWPSGITGPQTTAALAQLTALGMTSRAAYGV